MLTSFTCFALQYSAVDSNPLSIYVMHPFWNFVVKVRKPPVSTHHCFRALFLIASSAVLSLNIQGLLSISVSTVFTDLAGSKPHHIHRIHVPRVKFRHVGFLRFWLQRLRYVLFTAWLLFPLWQRASFSPSRPIAPIRKRTGGNKVINGHLTCERQSPAFTSTRQATVALSEWDTSPIKSNWGISVKSRRPAKELSSGLQACLIRRCLSTA